MDTYVIRNLEDNPVIIQFTDGTHKRLNPGHFFMYVGPSDNYAVLQDMVDTGTIDVYLIDTDLSSMVYWSDYESDESLPVEWKKEGF